PLTSSPFPYTPLFRSAGPAPALTSERVAPASTLEVSSGEFGRYDETVAAPAPLVDRQDGASLVGSSVAVRTTSSRRWVWPAAVRSEEHTSELQSRENL